MHTSTTSIDASSRLVDIGDLACGGCHDDVHSTRGGFVHRDGSGLCEDRAGRTGEVVEARGFGGVR